MGGDVELNKVEEGEVGDSGGAESEKVGERVREAGSGDRRKVTVRTEVVMLDCI